MSRWTIVSWLCLAVCVGLMASSCAAPPTEAMDAAEQAIKDARDGEADKYAKDAFQAATEEYSKAQKHMAAEEYRDARTAAEKTIELAKAAGEETSVGRELTKLDAETKLDEFLSMWKELSSSIEKGRGKKARALAKEASEYSEEISGKLNDLKGSSQWYELLAALEEANTKAQSFQERTE